MTQDLSGSSLVSVKFPLGNGCQAFGFDFILSKFDIFQREQMLAAHEMFKNANRVSRAEKALILGFMAGARGKLMF